jgi:hypothetical protein
MSRINAKYRDKALFVPDARDAVQLVENVAAMIEADLFDLSDLAGVRQLIWVQFVVVLPGALKLCEQPRVRDADF